MSAPPRGPNRNVGGTGNMPALVMRKATLAPVATDCCGGGPMSNKEKGEEQKKEGKEKESEKAASVEATVSDAEVNSSFSDSEDELSWQSDEVSSNFASDNEEDSAKLLVASNPISAKTTVSTPPAVAVAPSPVVDRTVEYNVDVQPVPDDIGTKLNPREQRNVRKGKVLLRGSGPEMMEIRKQRLQKRKKQDEKWKEVKAEELKAVPTTGLDELVEWFSKGYIRMHLVTNIPPGWLIVVPQTLGKAMTSIQVEEYNALRERVVAMGDGYMMPPVPLWWEVGMLRFPSVRSVLDGLGFETFCNFFGEQETNQIAIEVSLAKSLGIFRKDWIMLRIVDADYDNGGIGPWTAEPSYVDDYQQPGEPMAVDPADNLTHLARGVKTHEDYKNMHDEQEERRLAYQKYLEDRMNSKDFGDKSVFELDEYVKIKEPTLKEQGAGAMPPSKGAGNPGLDPTPDQVETREPGRPPTKEDDLRPAKDVLGRVVRFAALAPRPEPEDFHTLKNFYAPPAAAAASSPFLKKLAQLVANMSPGDVSYDNPSPDLLKRIGEIALQDASDDYSLLHTFATRTDKLYMFQNTQDTYEETGLKVDIVDELVVLARSFFESDLPVLKTKYQNMAATPNEVFVRTSPKMENISTNTGQFIQYGVPADNNLYGLFSGARIEWLYKHMIVGGDVMFAVQSHSLIRGVLNFFPKQYGCGHVWWWTSKVDNLPTSMRWNPIGEGSYNTVYRLEATDDLSKGHPDIDPFVFLPPVRTCYGQRHDSPGIESMYAASKQNGLLMRVAQPSIIEPVLTMERPLRELTLSCMAASYGFGPRVFAAWVTPVGVKRFGLTMNPGDANAVYADPMYNGVPAYDLTEYDPWQRPQYPWATGTVGLPEDKAMWSGSDATQSRGEVPPTYANLPETLDEYEADWVPTDQSRTASWARMNVLMESFQSSMRYLTLTNERQDVETAKELIAVTRRMSEAGFLHCDIKDDNAVYRTWRKDDTEVTATSPWDQIAIRYIDFDPIYCKLVPWLDANTLFVVNLTCYMAFDIVFNLTGVANTRPKFSEIIENELRASFNLMNQQFPGKDGLVAVFRALAPGYSDALGPAQMPDAKGEGDDMRKNPRRRGDDFDYYQTLNDPFEAARVFHRWVNHYLNRKDSRVFGLSSPSASLLARLIAIIRKVGFQNAKVARGPNTTAFDFEAYLAESSQRTPWASFGGPEARPKHVAKERSEEIGVVAASPDPLVDDASVRQTSTQQPLVDETAALLQKAALSCESECGHETERPPSALS